MTILIIEDDVDLVDALSVALKRAGYSVMTAPDGVSGLRLWKELGPQLVLLDIGLPRRGGWEVCGEIRRQSMTPVVIVTSCCRAAALVTGLVFGANDYVTKPFTPEDVLAPVEAALGQNIEPTA